MRVQYKYFDNVGYTKDNATFSDKKVKNYSFVGTGKVLKELHTPGTIIFKYQIKDDKTGVIVTTDSYNCKEIKEDAKTKG